MPDKPSWRGCGLGKRARARVCRAGHGHVVQPARRIRILAVANTIPTTIQHDHVVELQALGAMGGQQQQSALTATYIPRPFGQPLDEAVH